MRAWVLMGTGPSVDWSVGVSSDDTCLGYKAIPLLSVISSLPSENLATLWLMFSGVPDGGHLITSVITS